MQPANRRSCPVTSSDVLALLDHHLARGGTYGDPKAGEPIQYDELRIERHSGDVEIVVYDRAMGIAPIKAPLRPEVDGISLI